MNRLTEGHYRAQLAIRAATLARATRVFSAFDITDIDRSWAAVQEGLTATVWVGHRRSSELAGGYYRALRKTTGAPGPATVRQTPAPSVQYLDRVFTYTGLIVPKKLVAAGRKDAAAQTLVHVLGTVGRLTLNGGRDTLLESIKADPIARGYQRVTSGNACGFCEMLADRGAVYGAESGDFAAHDHCSCSIEPVFFDRATGERTSGEGRDVRDYTPSERTSSDTPEQRAARNQRARDFIAANQR